MVHPVGLPLFVAFQQKPLATLFRSFPVRSRLYCCQSVLKATGPVEVNGKESAGPPPRLNSAVSPPRAPLAQKESLVEPTRLLPGSLPVLESGYSQQIPAQPAFCD
jgi:hypothetical protein